MSIVLVDQKEEMPSCHWQVQVIAQVRLLIFGIPGLLIEGNSQFDSFLLT